MYVQSYLQGNKNGRVVTIVVENDLSISCLMPSS